MQFTPTDKLQQHTTAQSKVNNMIHLLLCASTANRSIYFWNRLPLVGTDYHGHLKVLSRNKIERKIFAIRF